MEIRLDYHSLTPLYLQIAEQLRESIATGQVKPGERLPPIRALSQTLNLNPNTVARAYLELEQERIIVSRRGGGTTVAARGGAPDMQAARQRRLLETVNDDIVRSLSQGYSPEEVEAAFYMSLERWREERRAQAEELVETPPVEEARNVIRIVGSHDLALSILLDILRNREENLHFDVIHAGSLGGLIALQEERADLAGTHLLDEETGEYNYPYVKRILTGRSMAIVNLAYRIQGLMFAQGNPRKITSLADLFRPEIKFVNRQKGSGTRVLLDMQIKKEGLDHANINGYEIELDTHLAVASAIFHDQADVGLGIEAAARSNSLGFKPLFRERYDLVIPREVYNSPHLASLLEVISSNEFKAIVDRIGGYDTSHTGETAFME
ncbi:MAG: GntR family transcriptional regulator [Dehalococcoidales bacterium]|nr:GntR family transcriptional regulator [Dehalococcoidales bacterium]